MRKLPILLLLIVLTSFGLQEQPKTVTVTFTVEELQVVYDALGELPAKKVEVIRYKIFTEAQKQLSDTIKKK
jgi:hypothetical protein